MRNYDYRGECVSQLDLHQVADTADISAPRPTRPNRPLESCLTGLTGRKH